MKVKLWTRLGGGKLVFLTEARIPPYYNPPDVLIWRGRYFVPEGPMNRGLSYIEVFGAVVEEGS